MNTIGANGMNIVGLLVIQVAIVVAVTELLVRCMPTSLRNASYQNCFRVGGYRSDRRTLRERRAKIRLRLDILSVLVLVILVGNIMVYATDRMIAPVSSLTARALGGVNDSQAGLPQAIHRDELIKAGQKDKLLDQDQFNRDWWRIILLAAAWGVISFLVVAKATMLAYKSFATGVQTRSVEYFQLDMTRMTISDAQLFNQLSTSTRPIWDKGTSSATKQP